MTHPVRLAPGESSKRVDPKQILRDTNRGAMWELIGIGQLLPALAQGVLLVLAGVTILTGMLWPSMAASAALIVVAIWSQRNVLRWAEAHNARVASAPASTPKAKPKATANRAKPAKNRRRP
jgi:hypothetical protein